MYSNSRRLVARRSAALNATRASFPCSFSHPASSRTQEPESDQAHFGLMPSKSDFASTRCFSAKDKTIGDVEGRLGCEIVRKMVAADPQPILGADDYSQREGGGGVMGSSKP
jgi:hypothetical protein